MAWILQHLAQHVSRVTDTKGYLRIVFQRVEIELCSDSTDLVLFF